jgi:hypothetical protein
MLDVLTPICVERFYQDAENKVKFKVLQETSTWNQADYVAKQGWDTMAGNQVSENQLAKSCASQILTAKRSSSDVGWWHSIWLTVGTYLARGVLTASEPHVVHII